MNAYDYLNQITYINRQINFDLLELEELKERASSISACNFGEKVSSSKSNEAPFIKVLEKIWEKQEKINRELVRLEEKREEIKRVVESLENEDEKMVLLYRFILQYKIEEIAIELHMSVSSIKRKCQSGMNNIKVPYQS